MLLIGPFPAQERAWNFWHPLRLHASTVQSVTIKKGTTDCC